MKIIIAALLVVAVLSGSAAWNVQSSLPSCYTGLPFNLPLTSGSASYTWKAVNIPSFVTFNAKTATLSGSSKTTGAWPCSVQASDSQGNSKTFQYIINVIDSASPSAVWASKETDNYYTRSVANPLVITPDSSKSTLVSAGQSFNYQFKTKNNVGNPVYAFINLPDGISGDSSSGVLSGAFTVPGIYTIGIQSADQSGNTAEGFVTITCQGSGSSKSSSSSSGAVAVSSLNTVTVNNQVPFVYDLATVHAQQTQADKALFNALAAVNAAKADLASRQAVFDSINANLSAAEAAADKAAAKAANANTDRENAAARLSQTNKNLNDAENALNLALLNQAAAQAGVNTASKNLNDAQNAYNQAQTALAGAEKALQNAQGILNTKKLNEVQANTALQNAQKDYNRANEDLNDAKNALNQAQQAEKAAKDNLTKATNGLALAQQAYDQAKSQLNQATTQLANAAAARQAALQVLQNATASNQNANTNLGAAEWNLNQAVAALNVANAAKDAADRTSALVIANGSPLPTPKVDTNAVFANCNNSDLPKYSGSVQIKSVFNDRALLATGNTILFGSCTQGKKDIVANVTINIQGVINPNNQCIEVYSITPAVLSK